ncbi:MAG: sodium:calcium antiporter [Dehalococcoidia bacterium]|nr:MAG: sodium:calcium antiporter [Dehalococcoidia bacterium]
MTTVFIWLKFALCVVIILVTGRKVAKYGDIIATKTGLGGLWVGLLLLALITSLPELFTGISAVALVDAPDIAIGDLFGSNVINLLILALLDIAYHNRPLLTAASLRHLLPAGLSMVLVMIATVSLLISIRVYDLGMGWVGIYTPILILLYLFMMRWIFTREQRQHFQPSEDIEVLKYESLSLRRTYLGFALAATFVIGAGIWLAFIGKDIAQATGWGESFVGSIFIAFTTSLPEIAVSFAALRLGAVDMCIANIIGSNLFNMTIVSICDLFYWQGPILAAVSESHIFTGLIILVMTGIFLTGLTSRTRHKTLLGVSWYVPLLIALFLLGAYISFTMSD